MDYDIPASLIIYSSRIEKILTLFQDVSDRLKSHISNLMTFYQSIDEFGMIKIHNEGENSIKMLDNLTNDIIKCREYIPFHLRIDFDRLIIKFQKPIEKEKALYLEVESKVLLLLKNMSVHYESENLSLNCLINECDLTLLQEPNDADSVVLRESNKSISIIEKKIQIVNDMFIEISGIVNESSNMVESIQENVIAADRNMRDGTLNLISAARMKAVALPIGSTLIGALVGGPIGMMIGLKMGLAAGVIGGVCGAVGSRLIERKKKEQLDIVENQIKKID